MFPKIIHYCWFGNNDKPSYVKECINSRKKYAPEYKIKEWNENNCRISCNQRVKWAYKAKKWAFVSDFFRLKALYDEWWVYLDTDMKLVAQLDKLINNKYDAIWWFDSSTNFSAWIIISKKWHKFLKDIIEIYWNKSYNWNTINSILNKYFPQHWILLNWLEQYSKEYNTIFYEANKISVDMWDWNAVVVDLHANSWVEWIRINHNARCYLDYLALHDKNVYDGINQIRAEYENSWTWKIWRVVVNFIIKTKLDKLYHLLKR